jgi:hypothetical protein
MDFQVEDEEVEDGFLKFHINHYPCEYWTRGAIHLHGHMYTSFCHSPGKLDVGIDGRALRAQRKKKNPQVLPEDYGVWSLKDIIEELG